MTLKAADAVTHREPASFSLWMLFGGVAAEPLILTR
jgi:hypothetical protein